MSIVDILKSLDELAKAITQKNIEVDELKRLYNHKISIINQYVEALPNQSDELDNEILDISLINTLENQMKCNNCNHVISLLNGNSDFVIIPKKKIKLVKLNESARPKVPGANSIINRENTSNVMRTPVYDLPTADKKSRSSNYYGNKSKKTCSYCKKTGHTRAKCLVRLNSDG